MIVITAFVLGPHDFSRMEGSYCSIYLTKGISSMQSKYEEKQAYENFIGELGIVPNHNFIAVSKGLNPIFFTYAKGSAFYEFFISRRYLLLFTPSELILKKEDQPTPLIVTHEAVLDFKARELPLTSYHCISFRVLKKKYYFYIDADDVFSLGDFSYSSYNYYSLLEKNFYGL